MKTTILKHLIVMIHLLFLFNMKPVFAQQIHRTVKESEYDKWGKVIGSQISEKGNWSTISISYATTDTVFLINNLTKQQISISGIREGAFMKENSFLWLKNNNLSVLNLKTLENIEIPAVKKYVVSMDKNILISIEKHNNAQRIVLRDIKGNSIKTIENTRNYSFDNETNRMVYEKIVDTSVFLEYIDLSRSLSSNAVAHKEAGSYINFKWNDNGVVIL